MEVSFEQPFQLDYDTLLPVSRLLFQFEGTIGYASSSWYPAFCVFQTVLVTSPFLMNEVAIFVA